MSENYEPSDLIRHWVTRANMRVYYNGGSTRLCAMDGLPCWEVREADGKYAVHYSLHEEDDIWIGTFNQISDLEKYLAVNICGRVRLGAGLAPIHIPLERNQSDASFDLRYTRERASVVYRRAERAVFPLNKTHDMAAQFTHYAELPLDELLEDLLAEESMFLDAIDEQELAAV